MLRKSFEFTKTIPAGIRSTSASFDEQRRSHSALSVGLLEVDDMELLLFGVAIVGTSAGSMLIGHAIARLVRSKSYRGITPIPLRGAYIQTQMESTQMTNKGRIKRDIVEEFGHRELRTFTPTNSRLDVGGQSNRKIPADDVSHTFCENLAVREIAVELRDWRRAS